MRTYSGFSLLLLGVVQLGACSDDGLATQSAAQSSTSTAGNDGSTGVTGPPATSAAPDDDTALPTSDTTAASEGPPPQTSSSSGTTGEGSSSGTSGEGTSSSTTSEGTTTGGTNQDCADGCAVELLCGTKWMSEADCVMACEDNLLVAADFSLFCRAAWEAVSACVATLTCEEFLEWQSPTMFPYPCSDADVGLASECEGQ